MCDQPLNLVVFFIDIISHRSSTFFIGVPWDPCESSPYSFRSELLVPYRRTSFSRFYTSFLPSFNPLPLPISSFTDLFCLSLPHTESDDQSLSDWVRPIPHRVTNQVMDCVTPVSRLWITYFLTQLLVLLLRLLPRSNLPRVYFSSNIK